MRTTARATALPRAYGRHTRHLQYADWRLHLYFRCPEGAGVHDRVLARYKGNMGRVRAGLQYEFVKLTAFPGLPTGAGTPNQGLAPNNNIAFFSFRYYPFN